MAILNDNQIRQRCLVPTHKWIHGISNSYYTRGEGYYYSVSDGMPYLTDIETYLTQMSDTEVAEYVESHPRMIEPFEATQIRLDADRNKIISYGTSSMGYDVRLGDKFKIFTNVFNAMIDPLNMPDDVYIDHVGQHVIIPPNSYVLGHTIEYFNVPRDILGICVGKSTYARSSVSVNVTPIEPGFKGQVVVELANQSTLPVKVYAGMGVAQFLFLRGEECLISYGDRDGKYQGQMGIQTALV